MKIWQLISYLRDKRRGNFTPKRKNSFYYNNLSNKVPNRLANNNNNPIRITNLTTIIQIIITTKTITVEIMEEVIAAAEIMGEMIIYLIEYFVKYE